MVARGDDNMYRIGEFSYLFELSIKTLRYYDEINLFKPTYKDPFTGYRYYSDIQKDELANILKLKDYGFTLDEIKQLKNDLSENDIISKINELSRKQKNIDIKIKKLEDLKSVTKESVKYKVGFNSNKKIIVVGKKIIIPNRNNVNLDDNFEKIKCQLKKMKLSTSTKVIITEEAGYKTEDVELLIGYLQTDISSKELNKVKKCKRLTYFSYPTGDYLTAIDVNKTDIITACKNIIEYSKDKNIQIIGPFMELYDKNDNLSVYTYVNDLTREEIDDIKIKDRILELYNQSFIPNVKLLGKWKIKEILPNIDYNPDRQKSNPTNTDFLELEFKKDGTTNYDNVSYSGNTLFIKTDKGILANLIIINELNGSMYLEIRMNDMSLIYPNAKPISYIYVR